MSGLPRLLVVADPALRLDAPARDWGEEFGAEVVVASSADDVKAFDGVAFEHHRADEAGAMTGPAVAVALGWAPPLPAPVFTIAGREALGFRWAVRHLVDTLAWPPETHAYGPDPSHVGDLRAPPGDGPHPVAVMVHGGGWRSHWARDLMGPQAVDLARRGFATWNIEYRRAGATGGGWPETFDDVAAAIDALPGLPGADRLDPGRVVLVGHSAGGQLSLLAARRPEAAVRPRAVAALASVYDMVECEAAGLSRGAVGEFLGATSAERPELYRVSSPSALLPIGVPQLLLHGDADETVPLAMTERYAPQARHHGDVVDVLVAPGAGHLDVIEPRCAVWPEAAAWLARWAQ